MCFDKLQTLFTQINCKLLFLLYYKLLLLSVTLLCEGNCLDFYDLRPQMFKIYSQQLFTVDYALNHAQFSYIYKNWYVNYALNHDPFSFIYNGGLVDSALNHAPLYTKMDMSTPLTTLHFHLYTKVSMSTPSLTRALFHLYTKVGLSL